MTVLLLGNSTLDQGISGWSSLRERIQGNDDGKPTNNRELVNESCKEDTFILLKGKTGTEFIECRNRNKLHDRKLIIAVSI